MNNLSKFYTLTDTKAYYDSDTSFPLLIVNTAKCHAVISLYGGQLLNFKATNKPSLLWLSPSVIFKEGKAIRGGVPICAPWFGEHETFSLNHGFARLSEWSIASITQLKTDDVVVTLKLTENELSKKYNYKQFIMTLKITLGDSLNIDFSFENHREIPQICEWAMHSYFEVENCETTTINGLNNYIYHDKTKNNAQSTLVAPQTFHEEVDRLFENASTVQTITNTTPITITGTNCNSVIVWNPGKQLASTMSDIAQSESFVCVERGAVKDIAWHVAVNQKEVATVKIVN